VDGAEIQAVEIRLLLSVNFPTLKGSEGYFPVCSFWKRKSWNYLCVFNHPSSFSLRENLSVCSRRLAFLNRTKHEKDGKTSLTRSDP
jgi:hypothetical protein